jgi:hypothetical protein
MKDEVMRHGDWCQTYTGIAFWPLDPREDEIAIEDIAHALSMVCRYGGHCRKFYSVAEHCVHVSRHVPTPVALEGLLHDASEAYLADVARPVKPFLANYKAVERALGEVIARKFRLAFPLPAIVKAIDAGMLQDESAQLMSDPPQPWHLPEPAVGVEIECWAPNVAKAAFLERFEELRRQ